MIDDPLAALASAWWVSLVASALLFVALAIAPIWDSAIYLKVLHQTLTSDPM
jgi:hypothetical protein